MINNNNLYDVEKLAGQPVVVIDGTAFPVSIATGGTSGGGSMNFYKCASVDTSAKTWTGYKAVLTDGVYSFEETVTDGLAYTENFPFPGSAYTSDLSVTVDELQQKKIADISGGEVVGQRYVFTEAQTLATGYFTYRKINSGWSLMWHVITHGWGRDYYHIIAVGLTADAVRMDASVYRYDPVEFTVDGDSRTWYYCRSQGVGANDGFTPIFDGNPIDVGSNGEDYLAQAKELLNNYLAGTIIGEAPEEPDNGGDESDTDDYPEVNQKTLLYLPMYGSQPFTDLSANKYSVTNNNVTVDATQTPPSGGSGAAVFNGSSAYLTNQTKSLVAGLTEFTIEFDYKLNSTPTGNEYNNSYYFFSAGPSYADQGTDMFIGSSEIVVSPNYYSYRKSVAYVPDTGVWHTLKVTRNSSGIIYVYIDSSLIGTIEDSAAFVTDANWCIGRCEPVGEETGYFNGYMANYRVSSAFEGESAPDTGDKTYVYTVSGAGTESVNGNYYDSGLTASNRPVYTNGNVYLGVNPNSSVWTFTTDPTFNNASFEYYGHMSSYDDPTASEYMTFAGTDPAPTVTEYTGGGGSGSNTPAQTFDPTMCSGCGADASGMYPTCSICGRAYCFNCIDMGVIPVKVTQCDTCYKSVCEECAKTHSH